MSKRFLAIFAVSVLLLASVAAYAQPADPPGNSDNAPGQQENGPGNSENAPGQQDDGPGNSENAPGQQKDEGDETDAPGNSENAPGQQKDEGEEADGPGNSDAAHACQQEGYLELAPAESPETPFENTGDCVSYAAQGGELVELEGAAESSPEAEVGDDEPVGSPEAEAPEGSPEAEAPVGTPVSGGPGNSDAAHACQGTGYLELAKSEAPTEPFSNIGDCVSYAAQGGELVEFEGVPATPDASPEASPAA